MLCTHIVGYVSHPQWSQEKQIMLAPDSTLAHNTAGEYQVAVV